MEEYLLLEEHSNVKHEFFDGQIIAMGGGTLEHAAMAARISTSLSVQLRGRRCKVYTSDARVRIAATGLDTYPDVTVACGSEEHDRDDPNALANPILLVEVTSRTSEKYDRGDKREHYHQIPSLREIVIGSHREPLIEVWRRGDDGAWQVTSARSGQAAELASIACALDVDEIYRDPMA